MRFGPSASGTAFKLTQAPGGKVGVKPFVGEVASKFLLNRDAEPMSIDDAGSFATTICSQAPPTGLFPKTSRTGSVALFDRKPC